MKSAKYNSVATEYDRQRPEYPEELIMRLVSDTGIGCSSRLLEIGAGTGKATMPLAFLGCEIDCIEKEANMAEILRDKSKGLKNISVITAAYEDWQPQHSEKYDLVFSAQAFHWLQADIKYKKSHQLLNKNGKLALFWYFSGIESESYLNSLNTIFRKFNTEYGCSGIEAAEVFFERQKSDLEKSLYFTNVREYKFEGQPTMENADLFIKRFNTTSAFASLDEATAIKINQDLRECICKEGDSIQSKLLFRLFIADCAVLQE